jgi:hypothetical protein
MRLMDAAGRLSIAGNERICGGKFGMLKNLLYVTFGVSACLAAMIVTAIFRAKTGQDLTFAAAFAAGSLWAGMMEAHRYTSQHSNKFRLAPEKVLVTTQT